MDFDEYWMKIGSKAITWGPIDHARQAFIAGTQNISDVVGLALRKTLQGNSIDSTGNEDYALTPCPEEVCTDKCRHFGECSTIAAARLEHTHECTLGMMYRGEPCSCYGREE